MIKLFRQQNKNPDSPSLRLSARLPPPHIIDDWLKRDKKRRNPDRPVIELPKERREPPIQREEEKKDEGTDTIVEFNI